MLITEAYCDLNRELHESRADYGTSSYKWVEEIQNMMTAVEAETVLDYGCGKGLLARAFGEGLVAEYDPAIPGKADPPGSADLVVCSDVMEHVEPECLYEVLEDIQRLARKGVFFTIATRLSSQELADGRNTHLIVEDHRWWLSLLFGYFDLQIFDQHEGEFSCLMTPVVEKQE